MLIYEVRDAYLKYRKLIDLSIYSVALMPIYCRDPRLNWMRAAKWPLFGVLTFIVLKRKSFAFVPVTCTSPRHRTNYTKIQKVTP